MFLTRRSLIAASALLLPAQAYALGGLISGLPISVPTRIIADRITPPNQLTAPATATQFMSRTSHTSQTTITNIALVVGNYYARNWNGGGAPAADTAPGAAATVTASVEYPAATFTQIKFSGSATGTIPDGDLLVSDTATLAIPNSTQFWVRLYIQCAAGICTSGGDWRGALGDFSRVGTSGVTDQTMSGTITNNSGIFLPPTAIIGTSTRPSAAIIGTSIAAGVGDNLDPGDVRHGFGRSMTTTPFINLAQGGATTLGWIADHPIHQKLLQYCTAMLTDHGTNDYTITDTATCLARLQTLYGLMPGKQIFQTTMLPRVTSSANGFTSPNDQVGQPFFTEQKALNVALRAGTPGVTALFDTDSILESGFETGWWRVATDGSGNAAPFTLDGTHPTQSGQFAIRDSGVIDQTRFT